MKRPIQFTLRGLFAATFWIAFSAAIWTLLLRYRHQNADSPEVRTGLLVLMIAGFIFPQVAIGALFGRAWVGLQTGLGATALAAVIIFFGWALGIVR